MTRRTSLTLASLALVGTFACFNTDQKGDPDAYATDSLMKLLKPTDTIRVSRMRRTNGCFPRDLPVSRLDR